MSDYKKEKVIRLKIDEDYLKSHLGIEDFCDIDCDERYSDVFDYGKVGKFQVVPTEDSFVDYVLESEYSVNCGEYGKTRYLYDTEFAKYKEIFSKVIPSELVTYENMRVVEYCWYNATECESYFDEVGDDFYDEV